MNALTVRVGDVKTGVLERFEDARERFSSCDKYVSSLLGVRPVPGQIFEDRFPGSIFVDGPICLRLARGGAFVHLGMETVKRCPGVPDCGRCHERHYESVPTRPNISRHMICDSGRSDDAIARRAGFKGKLPLLRLSDIRFWSRNQPETQHDCSERQKYGEF